MTNVLRRGLLTDLLLDHLAPLFAVTPVLLGDGIAPKDGGWTGQEAGKGNFRSYVILSTAAGGPNFTEPLRGNDTSWKLTYNVRGVGGNRQQADYACDVARPLFSDLGRLSFPVGKADQMWKITRSRYVGLGAVQRNDSVDPPIWECMDTLEVWVDLGP